MSYPDSDASLLARLLELPASEREAFLRQACASDPDLARRLPALGPIQPAADNLVSSVHPRPASPLPYTQPMVAAVNALEAALHVADGENSGARFGPYKLLQKIGEGGFGVVWMAEQQEPLKRRVALKIIKGGMDTEEVIARFEAERQALALMEHPNIARVYDAGATDAGRPFFVMELVRGVAITRYCNENRLSAEARLRLLVTVCQAVQHAHQKGVIHRDLKPSNILVTQHDGIAVPKIIDFGIAKATGVRLTDKTFFTQFHAFIGTPAYTSPEQMEMSGLDVDTRSDIYSLGVLLYELLAGQPPFDSTALVNSGLEAMRRTIREVDPPRPSQCLGTLSEVNRMAVAHHRGTDPAKLSLLLRGDLDWIAMRCLEKDRTRRYESATSLGADIERHLNDEVVEARPPSSIYQTKKFVRRHKVAVVAAAAVAGSLIAGLIASSALFVLERAAHGRALSAERKESGLRQLAEVARANEVKRAARTALDLANRNLADGKIADGLAYLVYASRKDPQNTSLGPRLASALATHNFLLPDGPAFECGSRVLAVRFTKDGRSIFAGTEDGTLRVFDAASGGLQHEFRLGLPVVLGGWEFPRNNDTVFGVRFADNTFGVFDAKSGQPRWPPRALGDRVVQDRESLAGGHGLGLSPDGRWVYALQNDRFWVWDAATGHIVLEHVVADEIISSCDFTPDGTQLAVIIGSSLSRWTLPGARPLATTIAPGVIGYRAPVTFSPNGRDIALIGANNEVSLYDGTTEKRHLTSLRLSEAFNIAGPPGRLSVVFVSPTRLFLGGLRGSVIYDLTSGESRSLSIARGTDVLNTSFDAAGTRVLTAEADGYIRICDLKSGELVAEPAWREHGACAALAPDGVHVVTGTASGTVQRLRIGRGAMRPLVLPRVAGMPLPFLPEAPSRLWWMKAAEARVLDLASGRDLAGRFNYPTLLTTQSWPSGTDSPVRGDMRFMVVPVAVGWQAWEVGAGGVTHIATLQGAPRDGRRVRFSPRGDLVAFGFPDKNRFRVWNMRTGEPVGPPFVHLPGIWTNTLSFSPDGERVALGTSDGACFIVDVATALASKSFPTRPFFPIYAVAFSPDGTRVISSNARDETRVWNAATGEAMSPILQNMEAKGNGMIRYSPDGRWFAMWGVHSTRLRDGWTGDLIGETIPAGGRPVCFSRDSGTLGAVDDDGSARVWDVPSGQPLTEAMVYGPRSQGLPEFSPDGRFLRTEDAQRFQLWSVPQQLPAAAPVPDWLLQLAAVLATKTVNEAGRLVDVPDAVLQFQAVRRELAALPGGAPLADWGRWIMDERADRSIAPGFTLTAAEADKLVEDERTGKP